MDTLIIIIGFVVLLLLAFWWQQSCYLREKVKVKMLYNQLREADRLKSESLARLSDELPRLLSSVIGIADALLKRTDLNLSEGQRADLATIRDNCQRLLEIVEGLPNLPEVEEKRSG